MSPSKAPETFRPRPTVQRRRGGGAWKVAYADFVTALMALFIVLWMMNSSNAVKQSITGYFHDPKAYTRNLGAGPANSGEGLPVNTENMKDIRKRIEEALRQMPDFQKMRDHVQLTVTGEGLRIDLMESEQGMFFITGSPNPTEAGTHLLQALAAEIRAMPNHLVIEGHTDARPFRNAGPSNGYGNWELSVDRANAARRLLHTYGIHPEQVVEVRGFADQKLMNSKAPNDPRNRRVSVVVKL
jgi:chemotaxis protein MotB